MTAPIIDGIMMSVHRSEIFSTYWHNISAYLKIPELSGALHLLIFSFVSPVNATCCHCIGWSQNLTGQSEGFIYSVAYMNGSGTGIISMGFTWIISNFPGKYKYFATQHITNRGRWIKYTYTCIVKLVHAVTSIKGVDLGYPKIFPSFIFF